MLFFNRKNKKEKEVIKTSINHIAFIMDGNGRWANSRGLPRSLGHKEGCNRIKEVAEACYEYDIKVMSLFCFSTENWKRSKSEIDYLFNLLKEFFEKEMDDLHKKGFKVVTLGDLSRLPKETQDIIRVCKDKTRNNKNFTLNICLNYGGKDEIVRGVKSLISAYDRKEITIDRIDEKTFESFLESKELPPIDVMVRTSGEQRISNYMLWELAYAELVFVDEHWPDFKKENLKKVIKIYETRDRRFGGVKNGNK